MTDERLAETTWRCAPGCRADNDAGLHKPECERPAETTEAERLIRQFIPQKSYGGGELVADPEYFEAEKAWEALDAILARLDALDKLWQEVTKERDMLQMTQEEGREIMVSGRSRRSDSTPFSPASARLARSRAGWTQRRRSSRLPRQTRKHSPRRSK